MNGICSISKYFLFIFWLSFVTVGCGGGSGGSSNAGSGDAGGSAQITYSGLTTPASISEGNAEDLLFGSLLGIDTSSYFTLSTESRDKLNQTGQEDTIYNRPKVIQFPLVLESISNNIQFYPNGWHTLSATSAAIRNIHNIINGNCGGFAEYTLIVDDISGAFDGTYIFSNYCEDGVVISGDTDVQGTVNEGNWITLIDITFLFENLTVDGFIFKGNVSFIAGISPSQITLDILAKDIESNKVYWANGYRLTVTDVQPVNKIETIGIYYDPDYGYVNVSTTEPLFYSAGDWPYSGNLLISGNNKTKALLSAINDSSYKIEADTDGDDSYDYNSGVVTWPGATPSAWQSMSSMPTPRNFLASGTVGGKIYAIGGYYSVDTVPLNTVEEYDPTLEVWNTKTSIPTARMRFAIGVVNNKLYAMGGRAPGNIITNIVEELDPANGIWTSKAPMPTPRDNLAAAVVNGKIYAIGGRDGNSSLISGAVEEYDPGTDSWTTKAQMPTPRLNLSACTANSKIYAIGGSTLSGPSDVVEVYDPLTDSWSTASSIPINRTEHAGVSINEIIFLFGGSGSVFTGKEVEKYDPLIDEWTIKNPMPEGGTGFSAAVANGKAYVIGAGDYLSGPDSFSRVYQYDPTLDP